MIYESKVDLLIHGSKIPQDYWFLITIASCIALSIREQIILKGVNQVNIERKAKFGRGVKITIVPLISFRVLTEKFHVIERTRKSASFVTVCCGTRPALWLSKFDRKRLARFSLHVDAFRCCLLENVKARVTTSLSGDVDFICLAQSSGEMWPKTRIFGIS